MKEWLVKNAMAILVSGTTAMIGIMGFIIWLKIKIAVLEREVETLKTNQCKDNEDFKQVILDIRKDLTDQSKSFTEMNLAFTDLAGFLRGAGLTITPVHSRKGDPT